MLLLQRRILKFILIGAIFSVLACKNIQDQPNISLDQIVIQNLKGEKVDMNGFKGQPLIINYWATWCAPCIDEFPYFEEIKEELDGKTTFIMISDQSLETINSFLEKNSSSLTFVKSEKSLSDYQIDVLPITYFFDSNGKLSSKHVGSIDKITLKNYISQLN